MGISVFGKKIVRNLFDKPATAMYPVLKNDFYPITRGSIHINADECIHCGICAKRCPTEAIKVDRPEKVWEIDRSRCIICNFCVQACPKKCLHSEKQYTASMTDKSVAVYSVKTEEKKADNQNLA